MQAVQENITRISTIILNITLNAIWAYLKDWKNILAHALVGLLILVIGLTLPIKPIYRIILLVVVIVLNTARMKLSEQKKRRGSQNKYWRMSSPGYYSPPP